MAAYNRATRLCIQLRCTLLIFSVVGSDVSQTLWGCIIAPSFFITCIVTNGSLGPLSQQD